MRCMASQTRLELEEKLICYEARPKGAAESSLFDFEPQRLFFVLVFHRKTSLPSGSHFVLSLGILAIVLDCGPAHVSPVLATI